MMGIVTSAVRDTVTNIMLSMKLKDTAINSAPAQILFARNNATIG